MTAAIARLKITLDDMEPAVIRRVEAPFDIRLDRLHLLIQAAMGWTNSHLYEIRAGDVGWGMPDPGWPDGPLDARKARLADVVEDVGTRSSRNAVNCASTDGRSGSAARPDAQVNFGRAVHERLSPSHRTQWNRQPPENSRAYLL
jgi:Plasmid pRiA4b ORF-3-like protein